jgi:hypothetical protein
MIKTVGLLILLTITSIVYAQDTLEYEIVTKLFKVGDIDIVKEQISQTDSIHYKLETSITVWFSDIYYLMESVYFHDTLFYSFSYITVNGKTNHYCKAHKNNSEYIVKELDKTKHLKIGAITSSITPLYFKMYSGSDSIFTEYTGRFRPFEKKNDTTFVLDPVEEPMEFIFSNNKIFKVIIPNTFLDFYIQRKN